MNSSKEIIQSITKELKTLLINAKKELQMKNDTLKKTKNVHEMTKKEYQKLYNEHAVLKKKLQQYEEYFRSQQIQKKKERKGGF